ncbi:uncharacterized protein LOC143427969 [Xylocopa sonorina]|uniref:uncharacterized protein LOC143427969 n=1 Tax=Xylocopa sonorina TaxID=1818115 RepID=UPI00403A8719
MKTSNNSFRIQTRVKIKANFIRPMDVPSGQHSFHHDPSYKNYQGRQKGQAQEVRLEAFCAQFSHRQIFSVSCISQPVPIPTTSPTTHPKNVTQRTMNLAFSNLFIRGRSQRCGGATVTQNQPERRSNLTQR